MEEAKVGVVIVNYFTWWLTTDFIRNQLLKQEAKFLCIAVVDNSSPNESLAILEKEFFKDRIVTVLSNSQNSGFASGNNIGIRYLENLGCDYILISNNDIELDDKGLVSECIRKLAEVGDAVFVSPVILTGDVLKNEFIAWRLPTKFKEIADSTFLFRYVFNSYLKKFYYPIDVNRNDPFPVDCLSGSFFIGSASSFDRIGYFDENTFLYYEETIIGFKVKGTGLQNYVLQSLTCRHNNSQTINKVFSSIGKFRALNKSRIYFWRTYMKAGNLFAFILTFLSFILMTEIIVSLPFRYLSKRYKRPKT